MSNNVIIIGGGASGLMAAVTAAENGASVTLLEPNERLGKKVNITGKGRCNVTNNASLQELIANVPTNGRFLYSAFTKFTAQDTINFFEREGVPLKTERGNRVFPVSDSAFDITDVFKKLVAKYNIKWIKDKAISVICSENHVVGVNGTLSEYRGDKVILCTGGKSYPGTGSTGDGYRIAKEIGHTVTALLGSLIPLESNDPCCRNMQGLSLKNVDLKIYNQNRVLYHDFGELMFTHFGITGPLILSASSHMHNVDFLNTYALIDLKPALNADTLNNRIVRDIQAAPNKSLESLLHGLLPNSMVNIFLDRLGLSGKITLNSMTKENRLAIVNLCKNFIVSLSGFRPINEAIITSGGIKISEINPKTMESKIISGLFFAGELIDVDAYTGGFNLQIAWSTGHLAGESAANL